MAHDHNIAITDNANIISVRLHSLATGDNRHFFSYPRYVTREQYIENLITDEKTGRKAQIINFNVNYIDDRTAKVIIKILSRMFFLKLSNTKPRGSRAFHIVMEEAHRYVQHDKDIDLLGYNIFERISKEGRKYGMFLAMISQRPSELSDTCVSQCGNFIILRTLHPMDLKYIREMVPNITDEIVEKLKEYDAPPKIGKLLKSLAEAVYQLSEEDVKLYADRIKDEIYGNLAENAVWEKRRN